MRRKKKSTDYPHRWITRTLLFNFFGGENVTLRRYISVFRFRHVHNSVSILAYTLLIDYCCCSITDFIGKSYYSKLIIKRKTVTWAFHSRHFNLIGDSWIHLSRMIEVYNSYSVSYLFIACRSVMSNIHCSFVVKILFQREIS